MKTYTLDAAIGQFEATEANLEKLDRLWEQIERLIPSGPAFGGPPEYEDLCLAFREIQRAMPAIDGLKVEDRIFDFDAAGQMHLDALEVGELEAQVAVSNELAEQGRNLKEYRFRLQAKRRALVRGRALELIDAIDNALKTLSPTIAQSEPRDLVDGPAWSVVVDSVAELDSLLGSAARPERWGDLSRHLSFGMTCDLADIVNMDWPAAKASLSKALYGQHDPLPVSVGDLGELVAARPQGPVASKLDLGCPH